MYLNKKSVIAGLEDLGDFKIITDAEDSIASDLVLVERKGSKFLLSFNDDYDDSDLSSNKSLESPFGVHLIMTLRGAYKKIKPIDKYKISNKLTSESKSIATVTYRNKIDAYMIGALYYPMVEQLQEFKTTSGKLEKKAIKFIVLSLLTMCFEKSTELNMVLEEYAHNSESLNSEEIDL